MNQIKNFQEFCDFWEFKFLVGIVSMARGAAGADEAARKKVVGLSLVDLRGSLEALGLSSTGLKKALQERLVSHMTKNGIVSLPSSKGKQATKPPATAKPSRKVKKIVESSDEEGSKEELSAEEEDPEDEDIAEEEEDETFVWQWADDGPKGHQDLWRDFPAAMQTKLEVAFTKKAKQQRVDMQRYVDLSQDPYVQCRYDDPTRRRLVQRVAKITSPIKSKPAAAPKAPAKAPKTAKKIVEQESEDEGEILIDLEDEDEENVEQEEEEEGEEEEDSSVEWLWAGDSPGGGHQVSHLLLVCLNSQEDSLDSKDTWIKYSPAMCKKIETGWNSGEKEIKVDKERYIDLQNMLQRRYDDKMK